MFEIPFNMCLTGSTKSGKTYRLKKIIHDLLPEIDYLVIIGPTVLISGDYDEFQVRDKPDGRRKPATYKFDDPKLFAMVIHELADSQDRILRSYTRKELPSIFIVIDDCVGHSILRFKGVLDQLSTKSRHYNISLCVLAQRITAVPRTFRLNAKYHINFQATNLSELERFLSECQIKRYRKAIEDKIQEIYNEPYCYILVYNHATRIKDKMYRCDKNGVGKNLMEEIHNE